MEGVDGICIDRICRSCLGEKAEMRSLFTMYEGPSDASAVQYSRMLMDSAAVSVQEGDGLPSRICDQCRSLLVQANVFKAMCERADAKLRAYMGGEARCKEIYTQTEERSCLELYNCSQCQKKFKGMAALQRHCRRHLRESCVTCSSCSNVYSDGNALQRHVAKAHVSSAGTVSEETKVDVWEEKRGEGMKEEPGGERVRVKEEPLDIYHDEDDTHSDYLPVKEEFHSDHSDFIHTSTQDFDKKKTFKKKIKKQTADPTNLPESHPCTLCPRVFASRTHLEAHEAKHAARAQRYSCSTCGKSFARSSHLKRHQLIHSSQGDTPYEKSQCPHCPKCFARLEDLERHIAMKHQEGAAVQEAAKNPKVAFCNLCNRGFTTQRYLEIHMRSHRVAGAETGQEAVQGFPCKACAHISETKVEARAHTQWHRRAERPFLCSECGQGFTRDAYLTVHMRRHRGEKPFSCGYCGKGFPRRSDLDIHERYHTEDKRHTCAICGKAFHRQYNLKVHLRVHTGERPYACPYCPKAFTQPNDLKAHVRRHTGERFTCELCSAQFLHGYHLTQHRRAVHAVDKPSHIRRLSKFPSAGPPHPPSEPPPPPTRGRARQAHIQLAAHMASILAQQQQPAPVPAAPLPLSHPPPAS